jgi:tetratricopeptide (TPR) repeat protein
LGGLVVAMLLVARTALAAPCLPWPGEPTPLPTRDDPDVMRALWAELRAADLIQAAAVREVEIPAQARRFWQHALCLDPESDAARAGLLRTPIVRVARPPITAATESHPPVSRAGRSVWEALEDPLPLALAPHGIARAPAPLVVTPSAAAEVDATLAEMAGRLQTARFEEALSSATRARAQLRDVAAAERRDRQVRLEVLSATAQLALGERDAAHTSLRRALEADPDLVLDPRQTSPKVLRALEQVRANSSAGEGAP